MPKHWILDGIKFGCESAADIISGMDTPCGDVLLSLVDVHHQVKFVYKLLVVANIKKDIGGAPNFSFFT